MAATSTDKKAEFRKYLEESGVMDSIVKALVLLYQEPTRPEDPLAFVANKLGGNETGGAEGSCPEKDAKIAELSSTIDDLKAKLGSHEPHPAGADAAKAAVPAAAEPEAAEVKAAEVKAAAAADEAAEGVTEDIAASVEGEAKPEAANDE